MILAGDIVHPAHGAKIPQVTGTLPVAAAPDGVPIPRGIHALPAVVGCGYQVVGPEELFLRIVNKNGVMRYRPSIVVQVMRTLGVGVVRPAIDRQVSPVVDRELILVEMLMLRE